MENINLKIRKKDLWLLSAIAVFLIGVGFVIAYNANAIGGVPSIMGHSIDEIELPNCAIGEILKKTATGWNCSVDNSGGGGAGGVTSISAGAGITLTPNPITSTGSISVNTNTIQARVSVGCGAGQAIQSIDAAGGVTCQQVAPVICTYNGRTYSEGVMCCMSAPGGAEDNYVCNADGSWSWSNPACGTYC